LLTATQSAAMGQILRSTERISSCRNIHRHNSSCLL